MDASTVYEYFVRKYGPGSIIEIGVDSPEDLLSHLMDEEIGNPVAWFYLGVEFSELEEKADKMSEGLFVLTNAGEVMSKDTVVEITEELTEEELIHYYGDDAKEFFSEG